MKKLLISLSLILAGVTGISAQTTDNNKMNNSEKHPDGVVVEINTTMGPVTALLYNDTPIHRDNFVKLAEEGYYDGVLFHRVIKDFMIQTGDPDSKNAAPGAMLGSGDPGYTLQAEFDFPNHYHKRGAIAAARTGDQQNPERRSSGSQFYIVTGRVFTPEQAAQLNGNYMQRQQQDAWKQIVTKNQRTISEMQAAGDKEALEALRQDMIKEMESSFQPKQIPEEVIKAYTTVGGAPHLDGQYTVFGEVLDGMEVVEQIQCVDTDANDRPKEDVKVISIKVVK